jgi:hypothetical protein
MEATLDILVTDEGKADLGGQRKDRGGPGVQVRLRMTDIEWARLCREANGLDPEELVRRCMLHAVWERI